MNPVMTMAPLILAMLVTTACGLTAVHFDRFQRPAASILAIIGGFAPWALIAMAYPPIKMPGFALVFGMVGSPPTFFIATLLYKSDWRSEPVMQTVVASVIGMFAGAAFMICCARLLRQAP